MYKCETINVNTKCLEYDGSDCFACDAETYPDIYLTDGICCDKGQKNNGAGVCTDMNDGCVKYDNTKCTLCSSGYNLYSAGVCCVAGKYYDGANCVDNVITNCTKQTATLICESCSSSYSLLAFNERNNTSSDKCCIKHSFYNTNDTACENTFLIDSFEYTNHNSSPCIQWDRKKMECLRC